jgi:hypothetical protein
MTFALTLVRGAAIAMIESPVTAAHARLITRRAALLAPLAIAACAEAPPPPATYAPLSFDYLPKIRLDVSTIDVESTWTPTTPGAGERMEEQAPVQPVDALRRMAQDRLVAAGASGHAVYSVVDASLTRATDQIVADFSVHLDISNADGTRSGYVEATIHRSRTISDYTPEGTRAALYELTRSAMGDINVEFEYQVRHKLKEWLLAPGAPPPPPVQQQELTAPPPPNS